MIISVHIPKAAGNTFSSALKNWYGSRLKRDYGDAAGYDDPEWNARRAERTREARAQAGALMEECDVIHGHFVADKYFDLFPDEYLVAFFRDPVAQTVSHYEFLKRSDNMKNPVVEHVRRTSMTLEDFAAWEATANPQSQFVGSVPLDAFAMVGVTEEFGRGVDLYNAIFAARLENVEAENVNPSRRVARDSIPSDLVDVIRKHREPDMELYEKVRNIYGKMTFKYDC